MVGGYGDLTRKHGLTSDRAVSAEVVLADGSVVTASSRTEPDLFWALRGGGSGSYGVVTSWTFETFPYVPRSYMYVWWDWSHMPEAFVAWQAWLETLPRSYGSSFSINATPTPNFKIVLFGDTGATDFEPLAQDLASRLTATATTAGPNGLPSPACSWDHTVSYGVQKSRLTSTPLSVDAMQTVKSAFDARAGIPDLQGTSAFLLFDGLRGSILDHPGDFNAYNHRSALCSAQFGARWTSLGTDPVAQKASTDWQRDYYEAVHDDFDGGCYQGYWDPEVENWAEMYYGSAFERLRSTKSAYDPDQFFRFQRSIPPA